MALISLSDFVAETLINISDGVRRAQDYSIQNNGIPIAPSQIDGEPLQDGDQLVSFSVELQADSATELSGTGKLGGTLISVISGEINADGSKHTGRTHTHTVSFSVPMNFNMHYRKYVKIQGEPDANP